MGTQEGTQKKKKRLRVIKDLRIFLTCNYLLIAVQWGHVADDRQLGDFYYYSKIRTCRLYASLLRDLAIDPEKSAALRAFGGRSQIGSRQVEDQSEELPLQEINKHYSCTSALSL